LRGTEAVNETFEAASRVGCLPRPKWLGDADDPALASADERVSHAASPDGRNGAAVSVFWPREQVVGTVGTFFDRLQSTLTIFTPLLDAIYSSIPQSLPRPTIEGLMQETSWPKDRLEELLDAVQTTQVVLAGPPGTGKTWVARKVAAYLTNGLADRVTTVQFHPSYGYEEFIEGVRPVVSSSGTLQFDRVDGVVLRLSKQQPTVTRVIVMDEMNRANLPRVLGELMYLFEYRGEKIALQHSSEFALPQELRFIGTMNTADRSIRSIDVALRRRFEVFECPPDPDILQRWYVNGNVNTVPDLLPGFAELNRVLENALDRHHTIGHTFFMAKAFDEKALARVWKRKIGPLLEEYFFDRPDFAAKFTFAQFWPSASSDAD
jgi:5-methylcytosine-specific restriction protein B